MSRNRIAACAAAVAAALLLWACVLTPGKFDAALNIRKDGSFTYRYAGEIVLVTSASTINAAAEEEAKAQEVFDPEAQGCRRDLGDDLEMNIVDDDAAPCTPEEIETLRKEHEEGRARRAEERRRNAEMSKAVLGGLDPADPKTMDEFARRLQGQEGWRRVAHKGNGVFDVHYEVTGRLDHAFVFPVFPQVDLIIPFVHATRLTGNRVRIAAPAFVQGSASGLGAMMSGMGGMGGMQESGPAGAIRKPEGVFTLTTDGAILTNNTQDGPSGAAGARTLKWVIGPLDQKKPEALLQL